MRILTATAAMLLLAAPSRAAEVPIELIALIERTRTVVPTPAPPQPPVKTTKSIVVKVKPQPAKPAPAAPRKGYPLRSGAKWMQNGSFNITPEHLANDHGFDLAWVRSLTPAERLSLHSDAHAGAINRANVVFRCPNGNCPKPQSRTVYRRR